MTPSKPKPARWKPDLATAELKCNYVGPGNLVYACYVQNIDVPVCMVWGLCRSMSGGRILFDISDIYVPEHSRRCGVATMVLGRLLCAYHVLRSDGATKAGEPLLKSCGFRRDALMGYWFKARQ